MMGRNQLILLGAALVVCVLLLLAPRIPEQQRDAAPDPLQSRIVEAINLVNGQQPMQGIMKLRDLAKENPENAEIQWHLGQLSIQSGQMDKAVERFERVVELDESAFPDAQFILGSTYAGRDSTDVAIARLERYKALVTESDVMEDVDRMLKELKQRKEQ